MKEARYARAATAKHAQHALRIKSNGLRIYQSKTRCHRCWLQRLLRHHLGHSRHMDVGGSQYYVSTQNHHYNCGCCFDLLLFLPLPGSPQQQLLSSPYIAFPSRRQNPIHKPTCSHVWREHAPSLWRFAPSSLYPPIWAKAPQRPNTSRYIAKGVAWLSIKALTVGKAERANRRSGLRTPVVSRLTGSAL